MIIQEIKERVKVDNFKTPAMILQYVIGQPYTFKEQSSLTLNNDLKIHKDDAQTM